MYPNNFILKKILFIFLVILLFSCKKQSIELPLIAINGESDVYNYSQIWVFYNSGEDKIKAEINKNNTISTTHWIINADKRLPMSEMLTVMGMVHNKRGKKSIHSSEGMHNYLSYANVKSKKIQLYKVDSIQFFIVDSLAAQNIISAYRETEHILKISTDYFEFNQVPFKIDIFNQKFFDTISPKNVRLFVDENMTYQFYLEKRLQLNTFLKSEIKIDSTEYFLNQ